MNTKIQILLVVAVFIFSIKLCSSSEDVINRNDFIKDHTMDIANIIHAFNDFLIHTLPPKLPPTAAAAAPFEPPLVCIVSQVQLAEIGNEIEKEESAEIGYPIKFTYSTDCNELDKIKTGILKMKHEFKELLKLQISSVKYEEMKATYENEIRLLLKRLDDERASAQGEQMEIVGELQDRLQKQQDEINKILKKLEDEQNALNEAYVALCVANIDRNEIDKSVDVFENITNYREIKRIVSTTYSTKPDSFEKIVLFVRKVSDPEPVLIGYTCLLDELTKQNQLRDLRILILTNELRTLTDVTFKELKTRVMGITEGLVEKNDFQGFIDYANTKGATRDIEFVKQVTPMIVEMVYDKPYKYDRNGNVEILMNLLSKFSNLHHRLYVINDIITRIKELNHTTERSLFLIIYRVIEARNAVEKIEDKYVKGLFADIENNLPEGVRVFLSSNVCIENFETGEFLFPIISSYFWQKTYMLATAKLANARNRDLFSHIFIFTENGNEVQIRNVKRNELLIADVLPTILSDYVIIPENPNIDFIIDFDQDGFTIKSKKKGYLLPMAKETIQRGDIFGPLVSALHQIHYKQQNKMSQPNGIWVIKQCELNSHIRGDNTTSLTMECCLISHHYGAGKMKALKRVLKESVYLPSLLM